MTWATEITDIVNRVGPPTSLWQGLFGAPVGTYSWNTMVESRAQVGEVMTQVMNDPDFHASLEEGQQFLSPIPTQDQLHRFVAGTEVDAPSPAGTVAEVITAVAAPGRLADALEWGPQIAVKVGGIIQRPTMFMLDSYGTFGQMSWASLYPDLAACDTAQDTLMNDMDYLGEVAKGSDLFNAGSGQRIAAMKIV